MSELNAVTKIYWRVTVDGTHCICDTEDDARATAGYEDAPDAKIEPVQMTEAEFAALGEFDGF